MAATPSKRKLNLSSDSETETPVAKRVHECLSDTSATSDQSDRLVIDLSYEAPPSPVDGPVTSTPARSESDWAEVARKWGKIKVIFKTRKSGSGARVVHGHPDDSGCGISLGKGNSHCFGFHGACRLQLYQTRGQRKELPVF